MRLLKGQRTELGVETVGFAWTRLAALESSLEPLNDYKIPL